MITLENIGIVLLMTGGIMFTVTFIMGKKNELLKEIKEYRKILSVYKADSYIPPKPGKHLYENRPKTAFMEEVPRQKPEILSDEQIEEIIKDDMEIPGDTVYEAGKKSSFTYETSDSYEKMEHEKPIVMAEKETHDSLTSEGEEKTGLLEPAENVLERIRKGPEKEKLGEKYDEEEETMLLGNNHIKKS